MAGTAQSLSLKNKQGLNYSLSTMIVRACRYGCCPLLYFEPEGMPPDNLTLTHSGQASILHTANCY